MKELDSVRGIAVLIVIAFHTFSRSIEFTQNAFLLFIAEQTTVGWIGVDIFFTLSGFLITGILLRTREDPHYFRNFYARRVLRILPVYVFLIVVVIFFAPNLEQKFLDWLPRVLLVMLVFQQNWVGFFFTLPMTTYLLITWSLAIEEQFYFVWPLITRLFRKATLLKIGFVYIALSILARILGVMFVENVGKTSIYAFFYYFSFARFEQLLIGALLAIFLTDENMREKIRGYSIPVFLTALAAFAGIVISSPVPSSPPYGYAPITIFGYTLIALFTAGLIAAFATYPETALIRRLFQNRVLEFFGKYSYAMYLFHPLVMLTVFGALWKMELYGDGIYLLHVFLTFSGTTLVALLTWNLIEKRALSLKKYFD